MRGKYLLSRYANEDPDVCPNDYGPPDRLYARQDYEDNLIDELQWAEVSDQYN